jgi:E3 ubiquitin-protein ligase BRE1
VIAEFKALVSSFPEEMGSMQSQLSNFKEASSDIHSLRADVQSLSTVLDRKVGAFWCMHLYVLNLNQLKVTKICFLKQGKQCGSLSSRSTSQIAEIHKLQSVVFFHSSFS